MELLTSYQQLLFSNFDKFTHNSFFESLPQSLPIAPTILSERDTSHIVIPDHYYFSIFFIFGGGLYILLLLPFTLRQKQCMAAPLLAGLFTAPIITSGTGLPALQLGHSAACGCVLMRMFDFYYIRPWRTGNEPTLNLEDWWSETWAPFRKVPMTKDQLQRYELELQQAAIRKESKRQADNKSNSAETPKGKPVKQLYTPRVDPNPKHWSAYLPRWLFYVITTDIIIFILSFITFEHIQQFSIIQHLMMNTIIAALVIFYISLINYTLMIIWAAFTGKLVHDTEWTLVRHYFPGFATSPAEFWRQWHHLFQYIWVDLGFKPVHHLITKYISPKMSNRKAAKGLELIVPVMGVFLMSGLMHEYMVIVMWHARPGYMTLFFLIQGAGTIVSKIVNETIGKKVKVPALILISLTWIFNLTTATMFMEPVFKNEGHNIASSQSLLLRSYNLLRSHGIF